MKIRMLMPVLAVLLVFGLANTAFAQLNCGIASTPVSRAADTGHTEVVGDIIFNCASTGAATSAATITIDYGVTLTNSTTYPTAGTGIRLVNSSGALSAATIVSVSNSSGQIVISLPAQPSPPANSGVTLTGVLASFNASGKLSLTANVSVSPGSNVFIGAGQNFATVVTSVLPGIAAPTLAPNTSPAVLLTSGNIPATQSGFSMRITENYIDAYKNANQFNGGNTVPNTGNPSGVSVLLTFSGIPTGVSLTSCSVGNNSTTGSSVGTFANATVTAGPGANSAADGRVTSTDNTVILSWATGTGPDITTVERFNFACANMNVSSSATIPLTAGSVTVTATLAPTGAALGSGGAVLTSASAGQIPRYASSPIPSPGLTVVSISPAQTNFIIPFVIADTGFDTGIAIANTTTDPFGSTFGARPQNGNITFSIFPRVGSSCTVTPSTAAVGIGLTSAGILESGRTYTVLLNELLKVTGSNCPATMTGYIIGVANFTNMHGSSFVTDFKAFTSYSPVLILPPPQLPGNARRDQTVEALNN